MHRLQWYGLMTSVGPKIEVYKMDLSLWSQDSYRDGFFVGGWMYTLNMALGRPFSVIVRPMTHVELITKFVAVAFKPLAGAGTLSWWAAMAHLRVEEALIFLWMRSMSLP